MRNCPEDARICFALDIGFVRVAGCSDDERILEVGGVLLRSGISGVRPAPYDSIPEVLAAS